MRIAPCIRIRRCNVRVVRHGGWSWGPSPRRISNGLLGALPELVREAVAGRGRTGRSLFGARVDVRVALSWRQLQELRAWGQYGGSSGRERSVPPVVRMVTAKIAEGLSGSLAQSPPPTESEAGEPFEEELQALKSQDGAFVPLLAFLVERQRLGHVSALLRALPDGVIEALQSAFLEVASLPEESASPTVDLELRGLVGDMVARSTGAVTSATDSARVRIEVALEVAQRLHLQPADAHLWSALEQFLPTDSRSLQDPVESLSPSAPDGAGTSPPTEPCDDSSAQRLSRDRRSSAEPCDLPVLGVRRQETQRRPRRKGKTRSTGEGAASSTVELRVDNALPFLLLRPLSDNGYLEALAASANALEAEALLPVFAAALAFKVLDAPERGWLRSNLAQATAAACGGRRVTVSGEEIGGLARHGEDLIALPAAVCMQDLGQDSDRRAPLILVKVGNEEQEGWLLVDAQGLAPIAWAADLDALLAKLPGFGRPFTLVAARSANVAEFAQLSAAGVAFVTDAPPVRGEVRQRLRTVDGRTLYGTTEVGPGRLQRVPPSLTDVDQRASETWGELARRRPVTPQLLDSAFDAQLSIVVACALGTIASTLWGEREPTDPLLSLERLGDLSANVRFGPEELRVGLPLGRRYEDLKRNGLLEPLREIPWLGRRTLEFGCS